MMTGMSWSPGASLGTGGSTERTTNAVDVSEGGTTRGGGAAVGVVGRESFVIIVDSLRWPGGSGK